MNSRKPIKIIKSAQRDNKCGAEKGRPAKNQTRRHGDREMAGQVAGWIGNFRQRRREEARRSFASLFAEPAPALNPSS